MFFKRPSSPLANFKIFLRPPISARVHLATIGAFLTERNGNIIKTHVSILFSSLGMILALNLFHKSTRQNRMYILQDSCPAPVNNMNWIRAICLIMR